MSVINSKNCPEQPAWETLTLGCPVSDDADFNNEDTIKNGVTHSAQQNDQYSSGNPGSFNDSYYANIDSTMSPLPWEL